MRLKHLQLQGYKTFATKTEFHFPPGITAIVGPNGSGKSNIADAIRWVLGEQSYSTLRGKRTVDMIFSGSQSRPRAGMAEAILTLDNSDGWLPLDFSEVTVERRAYRDGQNEYLINGSRVRLRDVTELLSQSGLSQRTYTVIGQGLVDMVLSLRPSERRALFEEAAGITLYRDKREDALKRLDETQHNLERVQDIIAEIEPRLKRLERQAQRTQEHDELSSHLEQLLRTWYGYRWGKTIRAFNRARRIAQQRAEQHDRRLQELEALTEQIDQARQAQSDLRRRLGNWHRQSSALHAQAEETQRELAVLAERKRQLSTQQQDTLSEIATLKARMAAQTERVAQAKDEMEAAEQTLARRKKEAQAAQSALDARLAKHKRLSQARNAARERQADLRAQIAERQSQQESLEERVAALADQIRANQSEIARLKNELEVQADRVDQIKARQSQREREWQAARQAHARLDQRRGALREQLERETGELYRLREAEAEVTARFELLNQLRRDWSIYGEATRALLTAGLPGVRGVLAQLIQVPDERLSAAVEAALGAYAGAVVVDDWQTAQAALRHLGESDAAGRVILLALDAPVAPREPSAAMDEPSLAAQIRCKEALRPLVDRLLGHTYLVPDLTTAGATLSRLYPGASCVTRQGELLRAEGVIEGGRAAEQASPLAQEREWSRLNARRVELGARREKLAATVTATGDALETLQKELTEKQVALDELAAQKVAAATAHDEAVRQTDRLHQEIEWRRAQTTKDEAELTKLRERQAQIADEITALTQAQTAATAEVSRLSEELAALPTEALNQELTTAQMALATAQQTRQGQETILHELQAGLERLAQEQAGRQRRVATLAEKEKEVGQRVTQASQVREELADQLEKLSAQIEPAEARLQALEKKSTQLDKTERRQRARLREFEGHLTSARLEVQRRKDEMERLRSRIQEDLGLVELELAESMEGQTPLPLRPLVSRLPTVSELPEGLEEEINRLRNQLRRLGAINPNALKDYQETLERHNFLQSQSSDLIAASEALHQVIAELDGLIEHAFKQTFEAVAAEFEKAFTNLFGGGKARLELTEPDDLTQTGVDIVAQPPGKRLQTLASLSGGERSLTAVALIFSILRVSPTPFCILDEVDAMLDEANVGRFRQMLSSLTQHTQIVIITHNRGTITVADTIYGISMGTDSVSQVYSLRMDGEKIKEV